MSVKKDASGRRSVELEFEVPGTPEQVWQAIATGPGISSWFVPAEVEERAGGAIAFHVLPGVTTSGSVTGWEPPRRFAYEERDWAEGAPPLATECIVETRSGGTCVVRLVHSLFASSEHWDDQLDSFEAGWPPFFRILRLYLAHFAGQRRAGFRLMGDATGAASAAWDRLTGLLGLAGATKGQRISTRGAAVPSLAGVVEGVGEGKHLHELILRLDEPAPGIALLCVHSWGGVVHPMLDLYLYGDPAPAAAAREEPAWQAWLKQHFPPQSEASQVA